MRLRACITLLLLLSSCATTAPGTKAPAARDSRVANLQRAAALPWADGGRCVVREASNEWPVLVERCFHALDHDKVRFRDVTGRCAVASAGAAVMGVGICILAAPEIVVGAVIITGAVVVAVAIKEELDAYELRRRPPREARPVPETNPTPRDALTNRKPEPEPGGQDSPPLVPPEPLARERRPDCTPRPVPHLGGNALHNRCADRVPQNRFPGSDVLVNGKNFDALQLRARMLWEVKTHAIETYNPYVRQVELDKQVEEARRERNLAAACGYGFVIGVRTEAHKELLERADITLQVVVMDWC